MTDPVRENWPQLIAELEQAGLSLHTQSKMIPCQFVQLQRLKAGAEPKYFIGERIKRLHGEHCSTWNITVVTSPATAESDI